MIFDTTAEKAHMDVRTAAERLHISEATLRRMVENRQIAHIRLGSGRGRVVFTQAHLDAYLQRRTVPVAQAA
jgi:excisionase family DNA binding protein